MNDFYPFFEVQVPLTPYGNQGSPDITKDIMEDVIRGLSDVDVYIEDIPVGIFYNIYDDHMRVTE